MPYKRKKWSPFTSNEEYTQEDIDQMAQYMTASERRKQERAEKSYQNMHDFGKGDIADSSQGSVWQKTDDKKKTNKYDRPKRRKKHYSVPRTEIEQSTLPDIVRRRPGAFNIDKSDPFAGTTYRARIAGTTYNRRNPLRDRVKSVRLKRVKKYNRSN